MRFVYSFCAVFLLHLVHIGKSVPLPSNEFSDLIIEVDPSSLENYDDSKEAKESVELVRAIARNKRSFDYMGYSSESSDESNNYGYYHKPQYHYNFEPYWNHRPQHYTSGYGLWPSRQQSYHHGKPHQGHHHHTEHCKYPYDHSGEYEGSDTDSYKSEYPETTPPSLSSSTSYVPNNFENVHSSTSIPFIPSTPSTENVPFTSITSSTTTTSTESGPLFDIRSSN